MKTEIEPKCRLEVRSEVLGDSIFWEGTLLESYDIRSITGRIVVQEVFRTGKPQSIGMWFGFPCDKS